MRARKQRRHASPAEPEWSAKRRLRCCRRRGCRGGRAPDQLIKPFCCSACTCRQQGAATARPARRACSRAACAGRCCCGHNQLTSSRTHRLRQQLRQHYCAARAASWQRARGLRRMGAHLCPAGACGGSCTGGSSRAGRRHAVHAGRMHGRRPGLEAACVAGPPSPACQGRRCSFPPSHCLRAQ